MKVENLRIRNATGNDFPNIERLFRIDGFKLDFKHLEKLMVVEDDIGIIAVGTLGTILEASFVTETSRSQRSRVIALQLLMDTVNAEASVLKYDLIHVFATNDSILKILKGKFSFLKTHAKQVLIRWIDK